MKTIETFFVGAIVGGLVTTFHVILWTAIRVVYATLKLRWAQRRAYPNG
jgi:hypothetical protein